MNTSIARNLQNLPMITCIIFFLACSVRINAYETFQLVGLFTTIDPDPFIGEAYGIYPREAARLAVEHVREEGLLDEYNYQLKLFEVETVCDQTGAVIATLEFIKHSGEQQYSKTSSLLDFRMFYLINIRARLYD